MRGVSAEGLAQSVERVESLAADGDAAELGTALFAVADLLGHEPSLRRAMTDPSADGESKRRLAHAVFDDKLTTDAVEAAATAAASRWSSAGDFVDAMEYLAALSLVIAADKDGQLSELEDELFRFARVVSASPQLRDAITNQQLGIQRRQDLVSGLLDGKVSQSAERLAVHAVSSRTGSFEAALEDYQQIAAARQQRLVALVRTAIELTDEQHDRLAAALAEQYGQEVHLNIVLDPTVLGGIRVELGDDVIDGTITSRLDEARRQIAG